MTSTPAEPAALLQEITMHETHGGPWIRRSEFPAYEAGQGDAAGGRIVRLSANENPRGPSPRVVEAIADTALKALGRYPRDGTPGLRLALAKKLGVPTTSIFTSAGSSGVIKAMAEGALEPGSEVVTSSLAFPLYAIAAAQRGARVVRVPVHADFSDDLEGMLAAVGERTRILFIASPNNPTGAFVPEAAMRAFLERVPRHVVVGVDLAYIEYASPGYAHEALDLLEAHPHVVLLRSFSKIHGLASLRVGYAVASERTCHELERATIPFAVGAVSQVAAERALADEAWVAECADENATNRRLLAAELAAMGIEVVPSQANFLLVRVGRPRASDVFEALRAEGIYTRPFRDAPEHLRVTVGTADECAAFVASLKKVRAAASSG
jgi:histidinol-phosphate aminotransferase